MCVFVCASGGRTPPRAIRVKLVKLDVKLVVKLVGKNVKLVKLVNIKKRALPFLLLIHKFYKFYIPANKFYNKFYDKFYEFCTSAKPKEPIYQHTSFAPGPARPNPAQPGWAWLGPARPSPASLLTGRSSGPPSARPPVRPPARFWPDHPPSRCVHPPIHPSGR